MTAGDLVTAEHQVEWRGVLWGWPSTNVAVTDVSGWLDMPELRGSNADRPSRHGLVPGLKRAGGKVIELELTMTDDDPSALLGVVAATALAEDPVEEDLVIWVGTSAACLVRARLERRSVPTDLEWSMGFRRVKLQFVCTDPRRYSVMEHTAVVGLPAPPATGLVFPLAFPLDFGLGTATSQVSASNTGSAPTWPVLTITGPVTGPIVANQVTGQMLVFDPTWLIPAGSSVVVDTDARSVSISGVSYRSRLFQAEWFPLPPGVTVLDFSSVGSFDAAASLSVAWRDADI